jgi:hemerythrin-like domain-containing protein
VGIRVAGISLPTTRWRVLVPKRLGTAGRVLPEARPTLEGDMVNDPMRILKADHREVEKLLEKLADSEEGNEREKLLEELVTKLTAHMEAEESIVYPPIRTQVGEEDEEEAEIEHGLAREGLQKLQSMVEMPGFGAAVEMLKGGITHHVEEEETQLLPELKDALSREDWLAIGDALAAAKEAAGLPVPQPPRRKSAKRATKKK